MLARDLTDRHAGRLISWAVDDTTYHSRPFAIEHLDGLVWLHYDTGRVHELRPEWEVQVRT